MNVYVAGQLSDVSTVRAVQAAVVAAGHELTLDWTSEDALVTDYAALPSAAAALATADLDGVMRADAVLVVASSAEPGRGLFVELGVALARAELGLLSHVVAIGPIVHDSVFWHHPHVRLVEDVQSWLADVVGPV